MFEPPYSNAEAILYKIAKIPQYKQNIEICSLIFVDVISLFFISVIYILRLSNFNTRDFFATSDTLPKLFIVTSAAMILVR